MTGRWPVERVTGEAGRLHDGSVAALRAEPVERSARILVADAPAVVLGSHEPEEWFDRAALDRAGLALARRHSGGGAVMVGAGQCVWVDFVLPAGDPLWVDDVGRAAWWVGELWSDAIAAAGLAPRRDLAVWRGAMRTTVWSPLVCFAGMGPGEVELGGAKVVGVSQRRTRRAALFQTAALLTWEPAVWPRLLSAAGRQMVDPAGRPPPHGGPGGGPVPAPGQVPGPPDLAAATPLGPGQEEVLVTSMMERLMP